MKHIFTALLLLTIVAGSSLRAQDKDNNTDPKGFRKEFLGQLDENQKKLIDLAGAIPAESYSWRPMEGVRSVSEVYMHVALSNYSYANFAGTSRPEQLKGDMEKTVTDKEKVIDILKRSFAQLRQALGSVPDANLDNTAKVWGGEETTLRNVFFGAATHMAEHLGQSIAYARMNKIVPPWTAAEEAAAKAKKK